MMNSKHQKHHYLLALFVIGVLVAPIAVLAQVQGNPQQSPIAQPAAPTPQPATHTTTTPQTNQPTAPTTTAQPPSSITQPISQVTNTLGQVTESANTSLSQLANQVQQPVSQLNQAVAQPISQVNQTVGQVTGQVNQAVGQVNQAVGQVKSQLGNLQNTLQNPLNQVTGQVNQTLGNISNLGNSTVSMGQVGQESSSQFQSYLDQIKSFFQQEVATDILEILPQFSGTIGDLGLPDPKQLAWAVYSQLPTQSSNQLTLTPQRATAVNKEVVEGVANSVLGQQGQTRLFTQQQQTNQSAQASAQSASLAVEAAQTTAKAAQQAQGQNVTQDVMKSTALGIAGLSAAQSATAQVANQTNVQLGNLSAQTLDLQMGIAAANLQLSSIDTDISAMHSNQKAEQDSQYALLQQSSSLVMIPGLKKVPGSMTLSANP